MTPRPHRLALADFTALAAGGGGAEVVRALVAVRRSRTMQLIRLVIDSTDDTADDTAHAAYRALAQVRRHAPAAVDRVLSHPSVGAWATRAGLSAVGGEPVDTGPLTGIAAAAAIRGRVPVTLSVPAAGELTLPSLGVADVRAGELAVRFGPHLHGLRGLAADWCVDGPGWRATPRVVVRQNGVEARFFLELGETLGPASGMAVAGELDLLAWQEMLDESWEILVRHHREVAREIAEGVRVLTPLAVSGTGASSATVEDAFGCILLSLGPDPESMAVSLAHELRHNKLVALLDLFPLLDGVPGERFYAPWRDDPRPLLGLLHGTYAYVGVTAFWRDQRFHEPTPAATEFAHTEFARWRRSALAATRTLLDSGRLTARGRVFVIEMASTLRRWCAEPVPVTAERNASRMTADHEHTWHATHDVSG